VTVSRRTLRRAIELGFGQREPLDCLKVTVAANEGRVHYQRGRGNPQVILIKWEATALLRSLNIHAPIGGGGNRLARQYGEQFPGFAFEFASAPSGIEQFQAEWNLAAGDDTHSHTVTWSDRREPGCHPNVRSHQSADRVGIEEKGHDGSVENKSRAPTGNRPANKAASSSSTSAALGRRGSCITRSTASGDPAWGAGMSELNCSSASSWTLLRCAAAIPSSIRASSSNISMVKFAICASPLSL